MIFISALNEAFDKVKAFALGGVDYITKPFQAEEVLSRIKTHLTLYHFHKQLEDKNAQLEKANTQLELTNKELKNFAYIVSHDLKAPLRGLTSLVHWLVEDYADAFDDNVLVRDVLGMLDPHERIFSIFQTLDSGDKDESSGIGLTIVKKIVESYGGEIWLESSPGKGSEFFFTLLKQEGL